MKFKDLKEKITSKAKEQDACASEYKRALKATTKKQLLKVVKENISWCWSNDVVTLEILDAFTEKLCNEFGIFYKGIQEIQDRKDLVFLADFKCEMLGNSTVNEMLGNSTVNEMWGNSTVNKMLGNSTVNKMWGNSTVNEMWGNSTVNKMLGNSTVNKMLGNSTVNEMWDNSTARSFNANYPKETGSRICFIDLKNNEVLIGERLKIKEATKL